MLFDPSNKIVQLCAQGMSAEALGQVDEASTLFQLAWNSAVNDFEAFIAAHYLARTHIQPEESLRWNEEALRRAQRIDEESIRSYYPSLYLNVGKDHEELGNGAEATRHYQLAAEASGYLAAGPYADMIKSGIQAGLRRMGMATLGPAGLGNLVQAWCERQDLRPLALVLPVYVSYLATVGDQQKLASTLSYVSAMRCLPDAEQQQLEEYVRELTSLEVNDR